MEINDIQHWHQLSDSETLKLLESDRDHGLEHSAVERRQSEFGPNRISQRTGQGPLVRFLLEFHQPLIYILLAAALITAILGEWVDSGVILGVVIVNAVIGFVQESNALKAIDALARAMTSEATVLRNGKKIRVSAPALVPGDIVFLQAGDKVPADLRLLSCRELRTDESTLTGESLPIEKHARPLESETVLADRRNMVYSSTLVTYGTATGIVVATGDRTEIGRISELITSADVLATPLTRKITDFSRVLLYAILGMAALTFIVGVLRGESTLQMVMAAVALAVGAIPEGLPAAMTITLAIGVSKMAKRNAIIRKLPAVETLGSTTVICSDKTGTLTQNQMTVREVYAGGEQFAVSGVGYAADGELSCHGQAIDAHQHPLLIECLHAGLLCNDSAMTQTADGWQIVGDPTEAALIVSAQKAGLCPEAIKQQWPRLDAIPFESQHQYMATLHDRGPDRQPVVYVKGSVEGILQRSDSSLAADGTTAVLAADSVHQCVHEMASVGLRVLAFARAELPRGTTSIQHLDVSGGLRFLGLQGMIDPPRQEAMEAVSACQTAGIQVKMITGDHAATATAIAAQIGLLGAPPADGSEPVITGQRLAQLSDAELHDVVERTAVFARVVPEQKLRLVKALQGRGHVVAMTGDGVNDAPALKQADIGVAMGISGTEVAKEAADMVLTDDNFASIEAAVEEGRGVFDNLTKFIVWTLPTNMGEGLVILAAVFVGATLPILPVQILWINMTTAVLLGLMLAFEKQEPGIMQRSPRDPTMPILTGALVARILLVSGVLLVGAFGSFQWALDQGFSDAAARTVAVNVFVIVELCYLFNCRSLTKSMFALGLFSNPWIGVGAAIMLTLQFGFTYLPWMNQIFHSAPIGWDAWWRILLTGLAAYLLVGLEKWVRRRWATA
jgi:Ca2+-transporting ATPase